MSMKLNAGKIGRTDLFSIDPGEIEVNEADNGRAVPHTEEALEKLASSILANGQLQPVLVRRIDGNRVKLVAGYGRWKAVKRINERGGDGGEKVPLLCKVVDCNDDEAFQLNIIENNDRQTTGAMDDAYNQRRLRDVFHWTEEQIKTFYDCSISHLRSLRKALRFPRAIRKAVADGTMALSAALKVAELPEKEQTQAIAEATDPDTGRVNGAAVRRRVREKKIAEGEGKGEGRTVAEIREFFAGKTGHQTASVRALAEAVVDFIAGRMTDEGMGEALERNCG